MSLHADLLSQAEHLAKREPKRPKQASLRRAISAAYYALFHLLINEACAQFLKDERLQQRISRVYNHGEMKRISELLTTGQHPKAFTSVKLAFPIPQKVKDVARTFVDLQQLRHEADYDLTRKFNRSETLAYVGRVTKAFGDWKDIRKHDMAKMYLASLLLWDKWDKTR